MTTPSLPFDSISPISSFDKQPNPNITKSFARTSELCSSVGVRGIDCEAGVSGWRPDTPTGLSTEDSSSNDNMHCEYSNTTEYRNLFRKITHQSTTPPENPFDLDEETLDELHYDESTVSGFLDTVFANTKTNPLFQTLYDLAAAKMISIDREIGLAVLFSYDYFGAFYPCYCEYLRNPKTFSKTNPLYVKIHQKL
jgi:hypothetical protein